MSKIIFVPLTDEMVFERPDLIRGPITAYQSTISENCHKIDRADGLLQLSGSYLKGDLLNGLEMIYVGDELSEDING